MGFVSRYCDENVSGNALYIAYPAKEVWRNPQPRYVAALCSSELTPRANAQLQRSVRVFSLSCQQRESFCQSRRRSRLRRRCRPAQGV